MQRHLLLAATVALSTSAAFPAESSVATQTRVALERATAYLRSISTEGGYLWRYSIDLKNRAGEVAATATQIWVQSPGTPAVGMAFLGAYEATRDGLHLEAARAAAGALARGQLESGGWDYFIEFDPQAARRWLRRTDVGVPASDPGANPRNASTYDDDTTQSALRFLLAFGEAVKGSAHPADVRIREALHYGLRKLLEAQYPNGAWPQRYDGKPRRVGDHPIKPACYPSDHPRVWPRTDYQNHYTLNDNTHRDCIRTVLDAYHKTGRHEFLEAARRGGDFIVLAQMPEPQPIWAQQYNPDMEPTWARAFEPPSVSGGESVGALRMLVDLYLETGEEKYLKPIPSALAWFERSAIASNRWARYYELHTNRQLFGDRDGRMHYRLQDISEERQRGYNWSGDYGVRRLIAHYDQVRREGRKAWLDARAGRTSDGRQDASSARAMEPRVRDIISSQDAQGRWVTRVRGRPQGWQSDQQLEMEVFIRNMGALADYLKAVR